MAWDDWVVGAATGGLYNVGKTAYKAGKAAEQAGDAVEEISDGAGTALAAIGSTVTKLGKDMSSFLKGMEELLTVKRLTPRDEDNLWDEEVERLNALRQREAELLTELEVLEAPDNDHSWFDSFFDSIFGGVSYEELVIRTKLAVVRKAINEILYEEPGVVPTSIYNLQQILERFNTLEQPRLEEILDSVDDNLGESEEILQEMKKLFVVKTWKAVPISELSEKKRKELEVLETSLANFGQLIAKNTTISTQLQQALVKAQPAEFEMAKMIGVKFSSSGGVEGGNPSSNPGGNQGDKRQPIHHAVLASGPSFALRGKVSAIAAQPMAASVATEMNQNVVAAYLDNYHIVEGRRRYYLRERLKVEKTIYRIKWVPVEKPGVIPEMLEEIKQTIARFRMESQPRVESVLDNVNATMIESTAVLSNVNRSLENAQGAFEFLTKYSLYIKIGLAVAGGLMILNLSVILIVLLRNAFGIG
ncbi:MAG: hypothetical protein EF812_04005 [Methanosarcinales archaeon]|nr:MAG: hypothetical protein EF812_04005 [Methanosarcinales archaeon]